MVFEQKSEEKKSGSFVILEENHSRQGNSGAKALRRKRAVVFPEQGGWHS